MRSVARAAVRTAFIIAVAAAQPWAHGRLAAQDDKAQVNITGTMYVNDSGNARVAMTYAFSPPRAYDALKRNYPNLYVLFRDFGVNRSSFEVNRAGLQIQSDDGSRTITFKGDVLGVAVNRNGLWNLGISKDEKIVTRVENRIFTSTAFTGPDDSLYSGRIEYRLPPSAKINEYAKDKQELSYSLPVKRVAGTPKLDVHLRTKKRLMAAAYKIYADPEAENGAYWVGKLLVINSGRVPIYDLSIRYRLGEYSDESVPDKYSIVAPGGAVASPYYPIISAKTAQLRNRTPTELRVTYEYRDATGKLYTGHLAQRIDILGINQFEFSNLSDEDRTESFFDAANNAPLLAAFVTKNDEPVRQFAGIISDASGGASASDKPDGAMKWLRSAYDQHLKNGIAYQTPAHFDLAGDAGGQEIKYPRDVLRDKAGTCIDLAITFAALAESVGLRTHLLLTRDHCFPVIELPNGAGLVKVEATGYGGEKKLNFDQAVEEGALKFANAQKHGQFILVDINKQLSSGRVSSPELPTLAQDFLEKNGIRRRR